jgi:hypothetical protein
MEENMNKMMITVTDRYINMKCKTDDEIKDYIKSQPDSQVIIKTIKSDTKFYIRTMHHPELYKICNEIRLYIDGVTDEWTFPLGETTGQFTRGEIESLIPAIKEALQMLKDKVYNTQHYIIEF